MIDNAGGAGSNIGYNEVESAVVEFTDCEFYGETEALECYDVPNNQNLDDGTDDEELTPLEKLLVRRTNPAPSNGNCNFCYNKAGFMLPLITSQGKETHPKFSWSMPFHKVLSNAEWNGETQMNNVKFIGFTSEETHCGAEQYMFKQSPYSTDYQHPVYLSKTEFGENSEVKAVIKVFDPPSDWASINICGDRVCTGSNNWFMKFTDTVQDNLRFMKVNKNKNLPDFQIVPAATTEKFVRCSTRDSWNARICWNNDISILLFESYDSDKEDRNISPVTIKNDHEYVNELNAFRNHEYEEVYSSGKRLSRFPAVVESLRKCNRQDKKGPKRYCRGARNWYHHASTPEMYIDYTGTPPETSHYRLIGPDNSDLHIQIPFDDPRARKVYYWHEYTENNEVKYRW